MSYMKACHSKQSQVGLLVFYHAVQHFLKSKDNFPFTKSSMAINMYYYYTKPTSKIYLAYEYDYLDFIITKLPPLGSL